MLIFKGSKRSLRGGPAGLFRDTDFATFKETLYCPCLDGILEKWVLKLRDEGNEMSYAYGTGIFRIFLFFIIGKDIQRCVMLGHMILVRSYKTQIRFFHGKLDPTFPSSLVQFCEKLFNCHCFFKGYSVENKILNGMRRGKIRDRKNRQFFTGYRRETGI